MKVPSLLHRLHCLGVSTTMMQCYLPINRNVGINSYHNLYSRFVTRSYTPMLRNETKCKQQLSKTPAVIVVCVIFDKQTKWSLFTKFFL